MSFQARGMILEVKLQSFPQVVYSLLFGIPFACHFNIKATSNKRPILLKHSVYQILFHAEHDSAF